MKITAINSFDEYDMYTEKYKNRSYFRGQANIEWNINPRLFRNPDLLRHEKEVIKSEMQTSGMDCISSVLKLQHYGTPTRICDLTISPLTALYFSVEDCSQKDKDGVVYVFDKSKSIKFDSDEMKLFSKVMVTDNPKISDLTNAYYNPDNVKTILLKIYIITYDYEFSYTNPRAILQGGTGLIFGFSFEGDKIKPVGLYNLENYLSEKIIIPSHIKDSIAGKLEKYGFIRDVLYDTFENEYSFSDFKISKTSFDLQRRADFNKIVAKYQINKIPFNREVAEKRISGLCNNLLNSYGQNARMWLNFYYDESDLVEGNFVCRVGWSKDKLYIINWKKDYYIERMRYINEQISQTEVVNRFQPLVGVAEVAYNDIREHVLGIDYQMELIIKIIEKHRIPVKESSNKADGIGKGNPESENYAEYAHYFIKEVQRLIEEILLYKARGEKEEVLRNWCRVLLEDCRKSKEKLHQAILGNR